MKNVNELLNLMCSETGQPIEVDEIVAIHNWGISDNRVIGYGKFNWDEFERKFDLEVPSDINIQLGTSDFHGINDNYDLFRTTPRKLNDKEKAALDWT